MTYINAKFRVTILLHCQTYYDAMQCKDKIDKIA